MKAHTSKVTVEIAPDPARLIRFCRVVARHLTALADDLEGQPDGLITFGAETPPPDAETVAAIRERWEAFQHDITPEETTP